MSELVKQGRFVANFLSRDEMSSVMHAMTVGQLCDRIEELERELAEVKGSLRIELADNDHKLKIIDEQSDQLAAEKALADRLWRIVKGKSNADEVLDTCNAYRKARGM